MVIPKKFKRFFIIIGLLICLFPDFVAAQEPTPGPRFDPRFGLVDSFVNSTEADVAGAGWTRIFIRWDVVQPAGPSDWKPANVPDTFLDAELAAGRQVVAVLIGTPSWATDSQLSQAVPPMDYWGDFVFKIATQYKGRINHWVIWNQPDINDPTSSNYTWAGTDEDYTQLLKEAYFKIKAVDPAMQVHLAGLTYTWDAERENAQYLVRLLNLLRNDPQAETEGYFFDVATYHLYYDPLQIYNIIREVRRTLDSRGLANKPIWINETNAYPSADFLEPPGGAAFNITLEEQAAFIIQANAMALAAGAERIAINKLRSDSAMFATGLLRTDNSRRPAFQAFQSVTTHFVNVQQAEFVQLGNINIITLSRDGQTTTVLWNTGRSSTTFLLNAIATGGIIVDELNNQQPILASNGLYAVPLPGATCSNGDNCFIGGLPRLIMEAGSPVNRPALLPSAPTPSPAPLQPTPTPTSLPSPTPPLALPTLTPTPLPLPSPSPLPPPTLDSQAAPPPAVLPDPDFDQQLAANIEGSDISNRPPNPVTATEVEANPTPIPPVTLGTVLTAKRLIQLFLVGVIIFTISYGVQVAIWYRLRR